MTRMTRGVLSTFENMNFTINVLAANQMDQLELNNLVASCNGEFTKSPIIIQATSKVDSTECYSDVAKSVIKVDGELFQVVAGVPLNLAYSEAFSKAIALIPSQVQASALNTSKASEELDPENLARMGKILAGLNFSHLATDKNAGYFSGTMDGDGFVIASVDGSHMYTLDKGSIRAVDVLDFHDGKSVEDMEISETLPKEVILSTAWKAVTDTEDFRSLIRSRSDRPGFKTLVMASAGLHSDYGHQRVQFYHPNNNNVRIKQGASIGSPNIIFADKEWKVLLIPDRKTLAMLSNVVAWQNIKLTYPVLLFADKKAKDVYLVSKDMNEVFNRDGIMLNERNNDFLRVTNSTAWNKCREAETLRSFRLAASVEDFLAHVMLCYTDGAIEGVDVDAPNQVYDDRGIYNLATLNLDDPNALGNATDVVEAAAYTLRDVLASGSTLSKEGMDVLGVAANNALILSLDD